MKKAQLAITAISVALAVVFLGLWIHEGNSQVDIITLCQSSASATVARFVEYKETENESSYWAAVSEFRAFQQAYWFLVENTNKSSNYTFCDEVYASLVFAPEISKTHIDEIISVMSGIANDANDPMSFSGMANLRNMTQGDGSVVLKKAKTKKRSHTSYIFLLFLSL